MAGSVNKVILVGNLGADPEIRNTQSGAKVATLSMATSESWKDQSGQKQQRTEWHRVVVFGDGLVGVIESYVTKGTKVYIEGQLRTRKWQDQTGNDRYTTEVVISGFNGALTILSAQNQSGGGYGAGGGYDDGSHHSQTETQNQDTQYGQGGYGQGEYSQDSQGGGDLGGISDDLDDDIPF